MTFTLKHKITLVVSAWDPEQQWLRQEYGVKAEKLPYGTLAKASDSLYFLTTGIGSIQASMRVAFALTEVPAINHVVFCATAGTYTGEEARCEAYWAESVCFKDPLTELNLAYVPNPDSVLPLIVPEKDACVATCVCTSSVTTDSEIAELLSDFGALENLELFGVALACQTRSVPCSAILAVTNLVGKNAHQEWVKNQVKASRRAQELLKQYF